MRARILLPFLLLAFALPIGRVNAKHLLADLNFDSGTWEMVCISVYNHNPSKLQQRLGTFALQSKRILREMQQNWNFRPMYEDHCDYHFVLKFYRDKELMKTLRVNVVCNYISEGVFSYDFNPELLLANETHHQKQPWSLVRFKSLEQLRAAVPRLQAAPMVYIYQDVKPYEHDGYFILGTPDLHWNVDRDSVLKAVQARVRQKFGDDRFYVVPYIFFMNEKYEISLRFIVYCSKEQARKFGDKDVRASWRSHFDYRDPDDLIEIVVVGVDDKSYFKVVYGR